MSRCGLRSRGPGDSSSHRSAKRELLLCLYRCLSDFCLICKSGKSSVINSILGAGHLVTYKLDSVKLKSMSTTTLPQLVEIKHEDVTVNFIDTPGFVFQESEASLPPAKMKSERIRDLLIRCRGRIEKMSQAEETG